MQVAKKLQMTSARARKAVSLTTLAAELEDFSVKFMPREKQHLVPSLRELRAAGFHDLACQFRRCPDKQQLADIMDKTLPSRGPIPGLKRGQSQHSDGPQQASFHQMHGDHEPTSSAGRGKTARALQTNAIHNSSRMNTGDVSSLAGPSVTRSSCMNNSFRSGCSRCRLCCTVRDRWVGCHTLSRMQAPQLQPAYACLAWRSRWLQVHPPRRRQSLVGAGCAVGFVRAIG